VGFADAFTFIFSPRDGTPATRLPPEWTVPAEVASERLQTLVDTVRGMSRARNIGLLGTRHEVLVEREAKRGEAMLMTRTRDYKTVLVPGDASMLGTYLTVELTGTTGSTFTGGIVRERQPLPMAG
jgi:tRNA-2-methylthio-N6-dimethylallyladenosine synthase